MRHLQSGQAASSGRSASWTLLLVVVSVLVLGFLLPTGTRAFGGSVSGGGTGGGTTGGGATGGGDDETIGTLPIMGAGGQFDLVRKLRDTRPDFYLEGAFDEILSTIVGYAGSGQVTLESRPGGHVRMGFHGQLQLSLDRSLLQLTGIQIGTTVPAAFRGASAQSGLPGQFAPIPALRTGNFVLPVAALDSVGALDRVPWALAAHSRAQGGYLFHALANGAVLTLGQSYY